MPPVRIVSLLICLALLFCVAVPHACAGMLVNKDDETYEYAVYWDDLSEPAKGTIEPAESVELADSPGTIALIGMHDSIYILPEETITILRGVMRKP